MSAYQRQVRDALDHANAACGALRDLAGQARCDEESEAARDFLAIHHTRAQRHAMRLVELLPGLIVAPTERGA